jgi:phosphoglycolate phosphatase-like HAD superfamily hydrolase
VAHHLANYAHVLVGSQQTEPGDGWPYDKVLVAIKKEQHAQTIAESIVNEYIRYYKERGESGVTQSAILLSKTPDVIDALHELGLALKNALTDNEFGSRNRDKIRSLRVAMQNFDFADYVDLSAMAQKLYEATEHPDIEPVAKRLYERTAECVLHYNNYGAEVRSAKGISVWFPAERRLYYQYRGKYLALNCNKKRHGWVSFLDEFHN